MEIGPGHLASSGNQLCPLGRTANFDDKVAGASTNSDIFSVAWPFAETMGRPWLTAVCILGRRQNLPALG